MPSSMSSPPKTFFRKAERVMVGFAMTVMAYVLEKVVMRTIRQEKDAGGDPAGAARPRRATRSSAGEFDVDLDEQMGGG